MSELGLEMELSVAALLSIASKYATFFVKKQQQQKKNL